MKSQQQQAMKSQGVKNDCDDKRLEVSDVSTCGQRQSRNLPVSSLQPLESTQQLTLLWPQLHSVLYALTSNTFTVSPILVLITKVLASVSDHAPIAKMQSQT